MWILSKVANVLGVILDPLGQLFDAGESPGQRVRGLALAKADSVEHQFSEFVVLEQAGPPIQNIAVNGAPSARRGSLVAATPRTTEGLRVNVQNITIVAANQNIAVGSFLGLSPLTNGMRIFIEDEGGKEIHDYLNGRTITEHRHFSWLAGDRRDFEDTPGNLVDELVYEWDLGKGGSTPVLKEGWRIVFLIQDDLSAINSLEVFCAGTLVQGW